jgi:hypothetical protein
MKKHINGQSQAPVMTATPMRGDQRNKYIERNEREENIQCSRADISWHRQRRCIKYMEEIKADAGRNSEE